MAKQTVNKRKTMNNKFDELTKQMAQSVTRRAALKTFGFGLAGMALARFGVNQAQAITNGQLDGNAHPNVGGGYFCRVFFHQHRHPWCAVRAR